MADDLADGWAGTAGLAGGWAAAGCGLAGRDHLRPRIVTGRQRATRGTFKTKVITRGTDITINAFYRHSRIKQYLKDGRALRIETVINSPTDLRIGRRIACLGELQDAGRAINSRLLDTERAGQGCVLANPVFERIARPTVDAEGRRATAMRFGDPRVQALAAPCASPWAPSPASPTGACAP